MERQLPEFDIEGTTFLVDVQQMALIRQDKPEIKIRFSDMDNEDTHYYFRYDMRQKDISGIQSNAEDLLGVHIPRMSELDPEGMALKYNVPLAGIQDKMDFEVMLENPELAMRMQGKLNRIEIENHPFYVDFNMWTLRPHNDFSTLGISMEPIHDAEEYDYSLEEAIYLYNPNNHELIQPDWGAITALPKDAVILKFPLLKEMDTVGYAHKFNQPLKELLLETNFKAVTQATKQKLSETFLPELFKENKERLAREQSLGKKGHQSKRRSNGI